MRSLRRSPSIEQAKKSWDDERSVMEKLASLGGIPSEQRIIDALYFVRYMTNEQWHHDGGSGRRVHDILGYPLSIRSRLKTQHD
jgi:hypothetical protein